MQRERRDTKGVGVADDKAVQEEKKDLGRLREIVESGWREKRRVEVERRLHLPLTDGAANEDEQTQHLFFLPSGINS